MILKAKSEFVLLLLALPSAVFARKLAPEVEHAMAYGAEAKICLKVCDDVGQPVTNASVVAVFDMLPSPHSVYGKTDTNGVCVVQGKTNGNKVRFLVGKEGYYGSQKELSENLGTGPISPNFTSERTNTPQLADLERRMPYWNLFCFFRASLQCDFL